MPEGVGGVMVLRTRLVCGHVCSCGWFVVFLFIANCFVAHRMVMYCRPLQDRFLVNFACFCANYCGSVIPTVFLRTASSCSGAVPAVHLSPYGTRRFLLYTNHGVIPGLFFLSRFILLPLFLWTITIARYCTLFSRVIPQSTV